MVSARDVRTIIHVDLDAFYCAVEEQHDPTLRGHAFAVGGRPETRGVVASCSYAARQRGIHSAMSMATALRLCPHLLVVPTRHSTYRAVSDQVMDLLRQRTPLLEQISIDEAFLDVTDLLKTDSHWNGRTLALDIQRQIREDLNLSCSVGVASNKMVAKIATDCGKSGVRTGASPQAICVVPPGEEAAFLAPLPVSALWGVGPKMEERLIGLGIPTIGLLAQWPERDLAQRFGRHGYDLSQHARGIDKREIVTFRESKSISSETTFVRDVQDWETLQETLDEQAQSVASQLKKQKLEGSTVKLKLRWTDFTITTRQSTLLSSTSQFEVIQEIATQLLTVLWQGEQPVRLLGVGVSGLSPVKQLSLWYNEDVEELVEDEPAPPTEPTAEMIRQSEKKQHLKEAIALLETRFGTAVVQSAAQIQVEK